MSARDIIEALEVEGLTLSISGSGGLLVRPKALITDDHRRLISENRQALIDALSGADDQQPRQCWTIWRDGEPVMATASEPITAAEARVWFAADRVEPREVSAQEVNQ